MNVLAIWAAHKAGLPPDLAFGMPAAVPVGGLDGFAAGALLSGACFLAVASARRPRRPVFARTRLTGRPAFITRRPARRPQRAACAGAHRSPPRWARTGRPRAEVRRVLPRHAAPPPGLARRMTGLLPGKAMAGSAMPGSAMPGGGRD